MYDSTYENKVMSMEFRKELLDDIRSNANRKRKARSVRAHEIYKDNLTEHVKNKLNEYNSPQKVSDMLLIDVIGICKKIINDEASIYSEPAKRYFKEVTEDQETALSNIYFDMNYDDRAKKHNRFFKLIKQTPSYIVPKNGKLVKKSLLANQYDIIENPSDAEDPIGYVLSNYNQPKREADQRYVFWTRRFNFTVDGNGAMLTESANQKNPISPELPFSMAQEDTDGSIYIDEEATEVNFCILINAAMTELYDIMRRQGFSQPVITIPNELQNPIGLSVVGDSDLSDAERLANSNAENNNKALRVGSDKPLYLYSDSEGRGASFDWKTPSPDLSGSIEVLSSILSIYLTSKNIDPKSVNIKGESSQSFSSGWERFLAMIDGFKATADDFSTFKEVEQADFKIIRAWHNALSTTPEKLDKKYVATLIPDVSYVDTEFYKPKNIQTEQESITVNSDAEAKGYQSLIMSIKNLYGYDNEKEAIEHLKQIQKDKKTESEIMGVKNEKPESEDSGPGQEKTSGVDSEELDAVE